jgi:hypothetical protein
VQSSAVLRRSLACAIVVVLSSCAGVPRSPHPADYLGQTPPGSSPQLFAPGLVSTPDAVELNGVFSPDFTEFFFARISVRPGGGEGVSRMYRSVFDPLVGWSTPEPIRVWPDDATSLAVDMTYSLDGNRLYFLGVHPHQNSPADPGSDLWVSERTPDGGWSLASPLAPPVWTEHTESYPAVTPDGGLQFSSDRPGGRGRTDLWRASPKPGGGFDVPINMGSPVNTEYGEGDSCASPDDRFIVFTSRRPGGPGNGDLYVSFRTTDSGAWTEPVLLGHGINTVDTDYCPMITPDGRYLFFSRRTSEPKDGGWDRVVAGDVYWISTSVIEALRP